MNVEKLKVDDIEKISKEILSLSATVRILQRKVELLKNGMEENERLYKEKKISINLLVNTAVNDLKKIMRIVQSVKTLS